MLLGCDVPFFDSPGDIRDFAQAAEELGYDSLNFSEHVASTTDSPFPQGFSFDDPWRESATHAAFLAAVTTRIELSTSMLLLALRPTVLAAKQAAEVDLLSGGRLRLGVAVGWNGKEVAALGQDPTTRGARLAEQVEVLRLLWTQDAVTYRGRFHDLTGVGIHPRPGATIPIWMGAGTFADGGVPADALLRRIARLADGYKMLAALGRDPSAGTPIIERLREIAVQEGRDPATIGIEARLITRLTPETEWHSVVSQWIAAGATHIGLGNRIAGGSVADHIELIARVMTALRG